MSEDRSMWRPPDPIPGPIVCPSWCGRIHPSKDDNVEDGITHVSEPVVWDVPERPENSGAPRIRFELVSFERPQGRQPAVLEVSAGSEGYLPDSFVVQSAAELDQVVAELHRTITVLRSWRAHLPGGR